MAEIEHGTPRSLTNVIELRLAAVNSDHLKSGDGGGTFDGMEQRVGKLETQMEQVLKDTATLKSDMTSVRERLARLEGEVSRLPGYGGIALIVGVIVALSTVVQVAARFMPSGG